MKIDFTAPIMPGNSIGNIPIGMHKDLFEYELDLNINKGFVYKVTKEENDRMYHYWIKFDITSIYGDINVFISKDDFLVKKIGTGA